MAIGEYLPRPYTRFLERYPEVAEAHARLGEACAAWGPLDEKTRQLVQLGVATAAEAEGAVKSHARRALAAGASTRELRHVLLLSLPTCGFPGMIAAMGWLDEVLEARRASGELAAD